VLAAVASLFIPAARRALGPSHADQHVSPQAQPQLSWEQAADV
jgi:hypothetical protein